MFADFENMLKGKMGSSKESSSSADISRIPQKYNINGKAIQELKLLSQGSFGFIWLAEDVQTRQKYALKRVVCITNERLKLAKDELQIMMRFPKSKNLVACYGGDLVTIRSGNTENKVLVILMEYCPNGTLFDLLQKRENKGFTEKELLQITFSILEGLKFVHQTGCYHQDVKIENVLIGEDNSFKLCDFGSCSNRFIDFAQINKSEYNHIKEEMEAVTTPMYRPPQMVDPYLQFEISEKVDIWMVGCVLYTLAYFTHPFVDSNAIGIAGGVYKFPRYPDETKYQVSDKLKDFIRNLLTPNPKYRPSVAESLQIVNNWYAVSQIPLNKQARRRKEEELIKEKELAVLNRKVVEFDGDIPMEKLMQLQNKLKNKEVTVQAKSSFVTSKDTKLIKEGKTLAQVKPVIQNVPNKQSQTNFVPEPAKPKQDSFDMNSFWNPASSKPASSTANKFDAFSNFFPTSNQPPAKKQTSHSDMYDEFFKDNTSKPEPVTSKPKQTTQINLLDL